MTNSILGNRCGTDGFAPLIAQALRSRAALAEEVNPSFSSAFLSKQVAALHRLADYVLTLDRSDQRLFLLWRMQARLGGSDAFTLTGWQQRLLAVLGRPEKDPDPSDALTELVTAAYLDLEEEIGQTSAAVLQVNAVEAKAEELSEKLELSEAELDLARGELAEAEGRNGDLQARLRYLQEVLAEADKQTNGDGRKPANGRPRKVKVSA